MQEADKKTAEEITAIKNYQEMERQKTENKHIEDKEKQSKKYAAMVEDYERRLLEETENYESELERI